MRCGKDCDHFSDCDFNHNARACEEDAVYRDFIDASVRSPESRRGEIIPKVDSGTTSSIPEAYKTADIQGVVHA